MATRVTTSTPQQPAPSGSAPGQAAIRPADMVAFPSGLPGFESCRAFVLLSSEDLAPLSLLQSADGPAASFLVIDPRQVLAEYRCALGQADLVRLRATEASVLLWLVVVSLDEGGQASVNLRAPIVINPERMVGYQVLPHNSLYPLRHQLTSA